MQLPEYYSYYSKSLHTYFEGEQTSSLGIFFILGLFTIKFVKSDSSKCDEKVHQGSMNLRMRSILNIGSHICGIVSAESVSQKTSERVGCVRDTFIYRGTTHLKNHKTDKYHALGVTDK